MLACFPAEQEISDFQHNKFLDNFDKSLNACSWGFQSM